MNALFIYAGALDALGPHGSQSNNAKLVEFWRLDAEIAHWQDTKTYKELFHSLEYALMRCRANQLIKQITE